MGFYKNTNSDIKQLREDIEYPIGTVVKYNNIYAVVRDIKECSDWHSTPNPCQHFCVFTKICGSRVNEMNILCEGGERHDNRDVYFERV